MIPESEIPAVTVLHDRFGVTAREARALLLLARGGTVPYDVIRDVYCRKADAHPYQVRHFRKKLKIKAPGIRILNNYGLGYELAHDSLQRVREALEQGGVA
ncbi:MAG: hypothetical protein ABFD96_06150 [Armatimonadia bacterium]